MRLNIPQLLILVPLMLVTAWNYQSRATWFITPDVISEHKAGILLILSMEAVRYAVSLLKFGRETCAHAWMSSLWGIILLMAFTVIHIIPG